MELTVAPSVIGRMDTRALHLAWESRVRFTAAVRRVASPAVFDQIVATTQAMAEELRRRGVDLGTDQGFCADGHTVVFDECHVVGARDSRAAGEGVVGQR